MSCSCWFFLVSYNKSDSELFSCHLCPSPAAPAGIGGVLTAGGWAWYGVGPAWGGQEPVLVCATVELLLSPFLGPRQGGRSLAVRVSGQGLLGGVQRGWDSSWDWGALDEGGPGWGMEERDGHGLWYWKTSWSSCPCGEEVALLG